jgi:hypothetical protein
MGTDLGIAQLSFEEETCQIDLVAYQTSREEVFQFEAWDPARLDLSPVAPFKRASQLLKADAVVSREIPAPESTCRR